MQKCECSDPLCPIHFGQKCTENATSTLFRIDMEDLTGTYMCDGCTEDAMDSGLFRSEELIETDTD
jgi:hypothetical protein